MFCRSDKKFIAPDQLAFADAFVAIIASAGPILEQQLVVPFNWVDFAVPDFDSLLRS